jgi:PGF-CTERM protein
VTVIADGPNDTYFVIVDTDNVNFKNGNTLPSDDDTALETNFTILNRDSNAGQDFVPEDGFDDDENSETFVTFNANEPDVTIQEPFNVSQAEGQTVNAQTNIAPGTEVRLRVRSDSGVSPSFLKTATPTVQSDGTFSATFDFSQQNVGDTYEITVSSTGIILNSDETEDGTVVEGVATATPEPDTATPEPDTATPEPDTATPEPDTATPEPDTDTAMPDTDTPTSTPTSTPGFGVVVALTALLAAALLAVRRD